MPQLMPLYWDLSFFMGLFIFLMLILNYYKMVNMVFSVETVSQYKNYTWLW